MTKRHECSDESICKICIDSKHQAEWRKKNREKLKIYQDEYNKKYYEENRDKIKESTNTYYFSNRDARRKQKKLYRLKNREHFNELGNLYYSQHREQAKASYKKRYHSNPKAINKVSYQKKKLRLANDLLFYLKELCSTRIREALKYKSNKKDTRTTELLGCSMNVFRSHIERQFSPGMDWFNHGVWHLDHIVPCNSFDLSTLDGQKACFNYLNIRPLWGDENIRKSDSLREYSYHELNEFDSRALMSMF